MEWKPCSILANRTLEGEADWCSFPVMRSSRLGSKLQEAEWVAVSKSRARRTSKMSWSNTGYFLSIQSCHSASRHTVMFPWATVPPVLNAAWWCRDGAGRVSHAATRSAPVPQEACVSTPTRLFLVGQLEVGGRICDVTTDCLMRNNIIWLLFMVCLVCVVPFERRQRNEILPCPFSH